jgi:hypothetical protein
VLKPPHSTPTNPNPQQFFFSWCLLAGISRKSPPSLKEKKKREMTVIVRDPFFVLPTDDELPQSRFVSYTIYRLDFSEPPCGFFFFFFFFSF